MFTEWAVEVIHGHAHSSQPFFLYLAYNAPHTPIQPPEEWIERVRQREPDASSERVKYIALVEHMDAGIGRVLDTLEQHWTTLQYTRDLHIRQWRTAKCGRNQRRSKRRKGTDV